MWNRNEPRENEPETDRSAPPSATQSSRASSRASRGQAAVIGPSISIRGDLTGEEDLVIEGRVEGEVVLEKNRVEVGQGGRVKADILAKTIHVLGEVDGNLAGDEEVIIRASGRVVGNISAPRVTLEDGCNFRGSVDMSPRTKNQQQDRPQRKGNKGGDGRPKQSNPQQAKAQSSRPQSSGSQASGSQSSGSQQSSRQPVKSGV